MDGLALVSPPPPAYEDVTPAEFRSKPSAPPMNDDDKNDMRRDDDGDDDDADDDKYRDGDNEDEDDDDDERNDVQYKLTDPSEAMNVGTVILILSALAHSGIVVYLYGYVFAITKFVSAYTGWSMGGVVAPGGLVTQPWYDVQWYIYFFMLVALLPPIFAMIAVINPLSRIRLDALRVVTGLFCLVPLGLILFFLLLLWFLSNVHWFPFNVANSIEFCCKYYGSAAASGACANNAECLDTPTSSLISLWISPAFIQTLIAVGALVLTSILQFICGAAMQSYATSAAEVPITDAQMAHLKATARVPSIVRILLYGLVLLYLAVFILFAYPGVLSLNIRHTHQYPANAPVGIQSARTFSQVGGIVASTLAILMPTLILAALSTTGRSWRSLIVLAVMFIITIVNVLGFFTMIDSRGKANVPGQPNSIASSLLYCCPEEIRSNPRSECDNTAPCVAPFPTRINQLGYNEAHTWMFGCAGGFILLDFAALGLTVLATLWTFLGIGNTSLAKTYKQATRQFTRVLDSDNAATYTVYDALNVKSEMPSSTQGAAVRVNVTEATSRRRQQQQQQVKSASSSFPSASKKSK